MIQDGGPLSIETVIPHKGQSDDATLDTVALSDATTESGTSDESEYEALIDRATKLVYKLKMLYLRQPFRMMAELFNFSEQNHDLDLIVDEDRHQLLELIERMKRATEDVGLRYENVNQNLGPCTMSRRSCPERWMLKSFVENEIPQLIHLVSKIKKDTRKLYRKYQIHQAIG